jgi:hypothetical protein
MEEPFFIKHYGKIIFLPVYALILCLGYFHVNLIYNQYLIDDLAVSEGYSVDVRNTVLLFNIVAGLISSISFLVLTMFFYQRRKTLFMLLFIPFVLLLQFFLSSTLVDLAEKENNFEHDSDIGLIWVIVYPLNIVMLFVFAAIFDRLKNKGRN